MPYPDNLNTSHPSSPEYRDPRSNAERDAADLRGACHDAGKQAMGDALEIADLLDEYEDDYPARGLAEFRCIAAEIRALLVRTRNIMEG